MIYTSMRGTQSETRPYREIPAEERRQILGELLWEKVRAVRERHNISHQTISHIRYHGKALAREAADGELSRLSVLKNEGKNSLEVSRILGINLETINHLWPRL